MESEQQRQRMPQERHVPQQQMPKEPGSDGTDGRAIITVVGKDRIGIIARVSRYLAQQQANVLDISQTILDGFFTMMMVVDVSGCPVPFADLADGLSELGKSNGLTINCQREEIFTRTQRI
jgi:ACT domain-containing protein